MKRLKHSLVAGIALCTLVVLLMSSGIANAASWTIVPSANKANFTVNELKAVATVSPTNVWAVGSFYNSNSGTYQTLTEQWNGSSWKVVNSPLAPSSSDNYLIGLKVISQNDIWAVGYYKDMNQTVSRTLTEHWNGTRWSFVPSPNKGTGSNQLLAVSASSSNDVWAVGNFYNTNSGTYQTLTEHWNGSNWKVVYSPLAASSSDNYLTAVSAVASNNVWAVGYAFTISGRPSRTLIEHWTGSGWSVVTSPNKGTDNNQLLSVSSVSASDIWAVGFYVTSSGGVSTAKTLTQHWNGRSWSVVASPNASSSINQLKGVIALSSNNVWAVGYSITNDNPRKTLIEHWTGSSWSIVSSPNTGTGDNVLNAVARVPGKNQAWAVGSYYPIRFGATQSTLIERYA